MRTDLQRVLRSGGFSLVVDCGEVRTFTGRGVSDLLRLLTSEPDTLRGASLADKVVGKAAASLMALAGVKEVYAEVISQPGLDMLRGANVEVSFATLVGHIANRAGTGLCPLEQRCQECATPAECLARIKVFVSEMQKSK